MRPLLGGGTTHHEQLHRRMWRRENEAKPRSLERPEDPIVCQTRLVCALDQSLGQLGGAPPRCQRGLWKTTSPASSCDNAPPRCTPRPATWAFPLCSLTTPRSFPPRGPHTCCSSDWNGPCSFFTWQAPPVPQTSVSMPLPQRSPPCAQTTVAP